MLELKLLGEFRILRNGVAAPLPPSRKTRALLAYLAAAGGSHRRERLSDLLWELPEDPRGSLRWSLSKLRGLVDEKSLKRIRADRETVALDTTGLHIDLLSAREMAGQKDLRQVETETLLSAAALFRGDFLEGLDMPNLHEFHEWCLAEREDARNFHARILRQLLSRFGLEPLQAIPHARTLIRIDPFDAAARASLIHMLNDAGRHNEAREQYEAGLRVMEELGPHAGDALTAAWRSVLAEREKQPAEIRVEPDMERVGSLPWDEPVPVAGKIIGRDAETERLSALLARVAKTRQARAVLITGEPGIGKSRLVEELVEATRQAGGTILDGTCYEVEAARAFGPWIDALRRVPASALGPTLSADLAPLLPELPRSDVGASRERMFGAVSELIAARAHSAAPVLLFIDDIHWGDEASAELLHYVVRMNRHRPLLVALTARIGELPDNPGVQRVLRTLRRERILEDIMLYPLGEESTAALVDTVASGIDAREIFSESAGNPLYVLELARALYEGHEALPHSLAELVRDRIERLPQAAQDTVRWASALGRTFVMSHLEALTGLSADALIDALEMLERHSIVRLSESTGDLPGTYRFVHELLRRAVYYDNSESRRRLMHARIARFLTGGDDVSEAVAPEVVRHAVLAGDEGLAASACLAAGERCLRIFANTEAEILARRGLRHAERLVEPERTKLQIALNRVLIGAKRPDDLDAVARDMTVLAERALDLGALSHARMGFQMISYLRWEGGFSTDAQQASQHAEMISRLGEDESDARIEALADTAWCLVVLERDLGQAEALALEAGALLSRSGREIGAVPGAQGMLCHHRGELEEAERLLDQARLLARRDGNRTAEFQSLEQLIMVAVRRRRFDAARRWASELALLAERLRQGSEIPCAEAMLALIDYADGAATDDSALVLALEALRVADNKQRLAYVLNRAAEVDLIRGEAASAMSRAARALDLALALDRPSEAALARAIICEAADKGGEADMREQQLAALRGLQADMLSQEALERVKAVTGGVAKADRRLAAGG